MCKTIRSPCWSVFLTWDQVQQSHIGVIFACRQAAWYGSRALHSAWWLKQQCFLMSLDALYITAACSHATQTGRWPVCPTSENRWNVQLLSSFSWGCEGHKNTFLWLTRAFPGMVPNCWRQSPTLWDSILTLFRENCYIYLSMLVNCLYFGHSS